MIHLEMTDKNILNFNKYDVTNFIRAATGRLKNRCAPIKNLHNRVVDEIELMEDIVLQERTIKLTAYSIDLSHT